jgi:hypothetical protein
MTDRVEVVGTGAVQVRPDALQVQLGAEATAPDVAAALERARAGADAMAAALRDRGVDEADVQTAEMSVSSYRERMEDPETVRAWLGISVALRDLATAGDVLAAVLAAGGDVARMQHAALAVTDPSEPAVAAREAAFADARAQAEQLAALAGRSLGAVRRVVAVPGFPLPRGGFLEQSGAARAMSLPVEAGSSTVTASVQVRFELD